MEQAAFDPQLSDEQLRELGRMTVNFGYVELLLDWLLLAAMEVRDDEAVRLLITPLPTVRKAEFLARRLEKCASLKVARLIEKALPKIKQANQDRNQIIHGYWAHSNDAGGMIAHYRRDPEKTHLKPSGISAIADAVAKATRDLYMAHCILNGADDTIGANLDRPHILRPVGDGSFDIIISGSGSSTSTSSALGATEGPLA